MPTIPEIKPVYQVFRLVFKLTKLMDSAKVTLSDYVESSSAKGTRMKRIYLMAIALAASFFLASGGQAAVVLTTLYSFGGSDGGFPFAGLIQGTNGCFYGTTESGGASGNGTIFKIMPSGALTTLYAFTTNNTDGWNPYDTLVQGTDGNFYGTTWVLGRVFRITLSGDYTILASQSGGPNGLTLGNDGNFYGTTYQGGSANSGRIFQVTPTGTLTILTSFNGVNGSNSKAGLVLGNDGNFYGTTYMGGDPIFNGHTFVTYGTVFKVTTNGVITRLFSFNGINGANPYASLVQGSDGNFYGTTTGGGANGKGTVFKITPNGTLTFLHSFSGTNDGYDPEGSLIQASDGNFYGTTVGGGTNGNGGTVFQMTPSGNLNTLIAFSGGGDGSGPESGLIQAADGNFYGTTVVDGTNGYGTIFRLTVPLTPVLKPVTKTGNTLSLTWSSVSNLTYQVQYRTNLTQTNWLNLGSSILATNGTMTATDTVGSDTNRFYRVLLLQ